MENEQPKKKWSKKFKIFFWSFVLSYILFTSIGLMILVPKIQQLIALGEQNITEKNINYIDYDNVSNWLDVDVLSDNSSESSISSTSSKSNSSSAS